MNDYILEISFDAADAALEEIIQSRLYTSDSTGSTSAEFQGTTTISAYFDAAEARDAAAGMLTDLEAVELSAVERERVDWLELYEQSLAPIVIGERFVVAPDAALLPRDSERLTIVVPQEQAFGTGSHETTSLCIELLESIDPRGARGLDAGAGSGILALAMHRLGASKVIAFDNDTDAYAALRENRMRNGVAPETMPLFIGSAEALRGGVFDVVTMNIIPEVIVSLLPSVVARMAPGARLILSGVLISRRDEIVAAARGEGLVVGRERERGEWWAGVVSG